MRITKELYEYVHPSEKLVGEASSVRNGNNTRFEMAESQLKKDSISIDKIIQLTVEFLVKIDVYNKGMLSKIDFYKKSLRFIQPVRTCKYDRKIVDLNYQDIMDSYGLNNTKHIVWMKFAHPVDQKEKKYLGVVARGDDVNFSIPRTSEDYKNKNYNTSGIIIHHLNMEWDDDFILLFPIPNVGDHEMDDVECGIGEYLKCNSKIKIPIIDFYSHQF